MPKTKHKPSVITKGSPDYRAKAAAFPPVPPPKRPTPLEAPPPRPRKSP